MNNHPQRAKQILEKITYVTIATSMKDGQPWNTPITTFRFPNDYTLYWASWQDNQHSKNIRSNGKAFVVIYDSTPDNSGPPSGVYMQGQAYELTDEQEVSRAALVFRDNPYNPSDDKQYLGEYPRRIYKFVPEKIWMNDAEIKDGVFIRDYRVEVPLDELRALLK